MASARIFWLVKGTGPATYEHDTIDAAYREATRLAMQSPGEVFHVLAPERAFVKAEVSEIDLVGGARLCEHTGSNEVPF